MNRLSDTIAMSLRKLHFLTILGLTTLLVTPLTGCDQKPVTPATEVPAEKDIEINAPGVDIDIERTPDGDGKPEVDVDILPGRGHGVDVEVDRE